MVEEIEITGNGFNALKDYNSWRIAQLGYDENINSLDGAKTFGKHLKTDEVFVLLEGEASIFTAGADDEPKKIEVNKMEKGKLYVIKEGQWHAAILKPCTRVLIVENRDTCDLNSKSHTITQEEKAAMKLL